MQFVRCECCGRSDRLPVGMDKDAWMAAHRSMACKDSRRERRPQVLEYRPAERKGGRR